LDEPTAMLDPVGREEVLQVINHLNKELQMAIVLITHHMEEVAMAKRVIAMAEGKIKVECNPIELFLQTELVDELGLDVPQVFALGNLLRKYGLEVDPAFDPEELVNALCRSN